MYFITPKNKIEKEPIRKINFFIIVYFVLTVYENILNTGNGSLLKYFGFLLIIVMLIESRIICLKKVLIPLIIWISVCAVSLGWTNEFSEGLEYVLSAGNMAVIAILVSNLDWNSREIDALLKAYAMACFVFAAILVFEGTGFRYTSMRLTVTILGKQYDPNVVVAYIVPAVLLLITFFVEKKMDRLFLAFAIVFMLYSAFLANSRGGLLSALLAIFTLVLMLFIKKEMRKNAVKYIVVISILGIVTMYFINKYVNPYLIDRIFNLDLSEGSSVERIALIKNAWQMFIEKPIFGWGCGGAFGVTRQGTHNMFMLVLADTGLMGFIPFMIFLISLFLGVWRTNNWKFCSVMIAMYGVIFFLDSYHAKYMWNIIVFALIIIVSSESNKRKQNILTE